MSSCIIYFKLLQQLARFMFLYLQVTGKYVSYSNNLWKSHSRVSTMRNALEQNFFIVCSISCLIPITALMPIIFPQDINPRKVIVLAKQNNLIF